MKDESKIPLQTRLEELVGFEGFMDFVNTTAASPVVNRAQVVCLNYVCFVYLGESCFNVLKDELPSGSASK